jgi:hypothetical protein
VTTSITRLKSETSKQSHLSSYPSLLFFALFSIPLLPFLFSLANLTSSSFFTFFSFPFAIISNSSHSSRLVLVRDAWIRSTTAIIYFKLPTQVNESLYALRPENQLEYIVSCLFLAFRRERRTFDSSTLSTKKFLIDVSPYMRVHEDMLCAFSVSHRFLIVRKK